MSPIVAILGRPNVGKSTLFNRLVGRKVALVDDQPGVTRDRREGEGRIGSLKFRIFDTAGLDESKRDTLEARMSAQAEMAVSDADLVLFMIDAQVGLTPTDRVFAERIRKMGKPICLLANKAESRHALALIAEAYGLGFGEPLAISAEHGEGLEQLYDVILPYGEVVSDEDDEDHEPVSLTDEQDDEVVKARPLRLAIIGQPNAGKSTLVNTMLGEERMLTGPEAGLTRDAVYTDWQYGGREIKLWDTAGIRRKSRVVGKLEKLAVSDALRAIRFADCVVVLIDASMKIERQDLALSDLVATEGRAVVLALSKWDLVEDKQKTLAEVMGDLEKVLPEIRGMAVVTLSAKQEKGVDKLMKAIFLAVERWGTRITTSQMNRWLEGAISRNPPPSASGRRIKIRYATQASTRPPTFAIFGNQLDSLPASYTRYLMNGLRKDFNLDGVPLRFSLRGGKNPFEDKKKRS